MKFSDKQFYILLGIGAVAVYLVGHAAVTVGDKAVQAINPANQNNVPNTLFNDFYSSVTGSSGTLGTDTAAGVDKIKQWFKGL